MGYYDYPYYGADYRQNGNQMGAQPSGPMGNQMGAQPQDQTGSPQQGMQPGAPSGSQAEQDIMSICQKYMNYHVIGQLSDGSMVEGIVDGMDDNSVTMLVPEDVYEGDRIYGGYGGYGRRRFRRFRRRRFPFSIFIFPFFIPFPYYY